MKHRQRKTAARRSADIQVLDIIAHNCFWAYLHCMQMVRSHICAAARVCRHIQRPKQLIDTHRTPMGRCLRLTVCIQSTLSPLSSRGSCLQGLADGRTTATEHERRAREEDNRVQKSSAKGCDCSLRTRKSTAAKPFRERPQQFAWIAVCRVRETSLDSCARYAWGSLTQLDILYILLLQYLPPSRPPRPLDAWVGVEWHRRSQRSHAIS